MVSMQTYESASVPIIVAYHVPKVFSGVIRIAPGRACFRVETLVIAGMLESDIRGMQFEKFCPRTYLP